MGDSTWPGIPFNVCICFSQVCCICIQAVDWKACAKWIELPEKAHADLKQLFEVGLKHLQLPSFIIDHMIVTGELLAIPFSQYLSVLNYIERIHKKLHGIYFWV